MKHTVARFITSVTLHWVILTRHHCVMESLDLVLRMRQKFFPYFLGPTSFYQLEHERTERGKIYVDGQKSHEASQMRFFRGNGPSKSESPLRESPTSWHRPWLTTAPRTNQNSWNTIPRRIQLMETSSHSSLGNFTFFQSCKTNKIKISY